MTANIAAAAQK